MCTQTTGKYLIEKGVILKTDMHNESGPVGGDAQVVAQFSRGGIGAVIFFIDHLSSHPHSADVQSLLRNADIWNIPTATNGSTASIILENIQNNLDSGPNPWKEGPVPFPPQVKRQKGNQVVSVFGGAPPKP